MSTDNIEVMTQFQMRVDPEDVKRLKELLDAEISKGKNVGGLRVRDSYAMRLKYLIDHWVDTRRKIDTMKEAMIEVDKENDRLRSILNDNITGKKHKDRIDMLKDI